MKKETKEKSSLGEIEFLKTRIEKLKKHLEKNKHDYKTKRAKIIKEARLYKLKKYIRRKNKKEE